MTGATTARNKVFISYSHEDADWLKCVRTHLRPLERALHLDINVWDDSEIRAGDNWPQQIADAVASARVIVLLVSPHFLDSDFIATEEIPLLEAAQRDGATILPLIISHSLFADTPGLSHLQTINDPDHPLINMSQGEQDKVFVKLAGAVRHAFSHQQPARREPSADAGHAEQHRARDTTHALKEIPRLKCTLEELRQHLLGKLDGDDSLAHPAALVAESVLLGGLRAIARRAHPKTLARLLPDSLWATRLHVQATSRPLDTKERKAQLIKYAAGDADITSLVEDVLNRNEGDTAIRVETGQHADECETVKGMRFANGFLTPDFIPTGEPREVVLDNAYIFITGETLSADEYIAGVIRILFHENQKNTTPNHSLLIIAEGIEGAAWQTLLHEKNLGLNITAARCPGFGDRRAALLSDIAVMIGSWSVERSNLDLFKGANVVPVGQADKAIVNEHETYLIGGRGIDDEMRVRVEEIRKQIAETNSEYDREKLTERLNNFTGGVTFIRVGGKSDEERRRKAERVRRVVKHYEAAYVFGVVAGEHLALANAAAYLRARNPPEESKLADAIVADALEAPLRQMAEGLARDGDETLRTIRLKQSEGKNLDIGYYGEEDSFVDLFEAGAIVPMLNYITLTHKAVEAASQQLAAFRFTDEVVREVAALDPQ